MAAAETVNKKLLVEGAGQRPVVRVVKKFTFMITVAVTMFGCAVVASAIGTAYRSPAHWYAYSTAPVL